jgi:hypothetical protein
MKLKLVVLDLELSRKQKRILGAMFALALSAGGATIAFAGQKLFVSGDTLAAADLNGNFADINTRLPTVTEWASYTPTVKANGTAVTTTSAKPALWRRVGDTVEVIIDESFPSCTPSGLLVWSLPPGLAADYSKIPGPNSLIGTSLTNTQSFTQNTIGEVLIQPQNVVALEEGDNVVTCATLGNGGEVRMTFALPIQGWQIAN